MTIWRANSSGEKSKMEDRYKSLRDFYESLLEYPEVLTYNNGSNKQSLTADFISSSSQSHHLVFYDKHLMAEFDNNNDMFADATFKICPNVKGVSQVLTVMCKKLNTPFRVTCDYEKAFMKSVRKAFKAHVRGCYFHFAQAIVRKAKSKDYRLYKRNNAKENPKGEQIIKKLLVLPLLPANNIPEGFDVILKLVKKLFIDEPKYLERWSKFLNNYFTKEWMKKVKPETFSVFNSVDRTNNYLESYHRTLNKFIRANPTTHQFSIKQINQQSKWDLERAAQVMKTTDARKSTLKLRENIIRDAWIQIRAEPRPWTVEQFINELSGYNDTSFFENIEQSIKLADENEDLEDSDDSVDDDSDSDLEDFEYKLECENVNVESHKTEEPVTIASSQSAKRGRKTPKNVVPRKSQRLLLKKQS
uniref:MULE transposase domain-containing protein n=1 Tax=Trichogramma kaykai TaxID=54128 RepID=A0ABD2XDD1_9HYME